jgi:putative addiction module component (TIGR02574 family)
MPPSKIRKEMFKLSSAERILLVQDLWDTIADDDDFDITPAQARELDRRMKAIEKRKQQGRSTSLTWPQLKRKLLRKK